MALDVAVIVISARHQYEDFYSDVALGMNDSLTTYYGLADASYTNEWNYLQSGSKCCGAEKYTDWFASKWSMNAIAGKGNYSHGVLPISCRNAVALSAPCIAIQGSNIELNSQYLFLSNFTAVTFCESQLVVDGTVDYIHGLPCSNLYYSVLYDDIRSIMVVNVVLLAIELFLILLMYNLTSHLPKSPRICMTNNDTITS